MGAHLISPKQHLSELELELLQLWLLQLGPAELEGERTGLANALALAAEQRRLLLLLHWPALPELVQAKNAPRSRSMPLQGELLWEAP